jgi:hypothetical protein
MPDGVPAPGATTETVAVNVTVWPTSEEVISAERDVVVPALLTVWLMAALLVAKFPSPLYVAVISCVGSAAVAVDR